MAMDISANVDSAAHCRDTPGALYDLPRHKLYDQEAQMKLDLKALHTVAELGIEREAKDAEFVFDPHELLTMIETLEVAAAISKVRDQDALHRLDTWLTKYFGEEEGGA